MLGKTRAQNCSKVNQEVKLFKPNQEVKVFHENKCSGRNRVEKVVKAVSHSEREGREESKKRAEKGSRQRKEQDVSTVST